MEFYIVFVLNFLLTFDPFTNVVYTLFPNYIKCIFLENVVYFYLYWWQWRYFYGVVELSVKLLSIAFYSKFYIRQMSPKVLPTYLRKVRPEEVNLLGPSHICQYEVHVKALSCDLNLSLYLSPVVFVSFPSSSPSEGPVLTVSRSSLKGRVSFPLTLWTFSGVEVNLNTTGPVPS